MLEVVWTSEAEAQLQYFFAILDHEAASVAIDWLAAVEARVALLPQFPEMAPLWHPPFRRLLIARKLGLFYAIHGQRIFLSGIYPLSMSPEKIRARLEQTDWP